MVHNVAADELHPEVRAYNQAYSSNSPAAEAPVMWLAALVLLLPYVPGTVVGADMGSELRQSLMRTVLLYAGMLHLQSECGITMGNSSSSRQLCIFPNGSSQRWQVIESGCTQGRCTCCLCLPNLCEVFQRSQQQWKVCKCFNLPVSPPLQASKS